ncbi:Glycosyl_hydrolase family 25 protein [Hexamita inflata]|uniref:Glycosyl_hydrolase family 25 protein n=1 Tax=Hexamita inflata TaxID=28002 RepID=A0ABP1HWX7_9EUKA
MLLTAITLQTRGFDVSYYQGAVTQATFTCLHNAGYQFAIIQAQIGSTFNVNAISDYQRAKDVDFYIFPTTVKDARGQVRDTIQRLQNAGVMSGNMVWLDIESIDLFYPTYASVVFSSLSFVALRFMYWIVMIGKVIVYCSNPCQGLYQFVLVMVFVFFIGQVFRVLICFTYVLCVEVSFLSFVGDLLCFLWSILLIFVMFIMTQWTYMSMIPRFWSVSVKHDVDCSLKFHVCKVMIFVQNLCCKRIHVSNQRCAILLFIVFFEFDEQVFVLQLLGSIEFVRYFEVSKFRPGNMLLKPFLFSGADMILMKFYIVIWRYSPIKSSSVNYLGFVIRQKVCAISSSIRLQSQMVSFTQSSIRSAQLIFGISDTKNIPSACERPCPLSRSCSISKQISSAVWISFLEVCNLGSKKLNSILVLIFYQEVIQNSCLILKRCQITHSKYIKAVAQMIKQNHLDWKQR